MCFAEFFTTGQLIGLSMVWNLGCSHELSLQSFDNTYSRGSLFISFFRSDVWFASVNAVRDPGTEQTSS